MKRMETEKDRELLPLLEQLKFEYDGMTLVLEELLFTLKHSGQDGPQKGEHHE